LSAKKKIVLLHRKAADRLAAAVSYGRGKSGQHRAFRFLMGSSPQGLDHAEENNRLVRQGKGEKVG